MWYRRFELSVIGKPFSPFEFLHVFFSTTDAYLGGTPTGSQPCLPYTRDVATRQVRDSFLFPISASSLDIHASSKINIRQSVDVVEISRIADSRVAGDHSVDRNTTSAAMPV